MRFDDLPKAAARRHPAIMLPAPCASGPDSIRDLAAEISRPKSYRRAAFCGPFSLKDPLTGALLTARQLRTTVTCKGRLHEGEAR